MTLLTCLVIYAALVHARIGSWQKCRPRPKVYLHRYSAPQHGTAWYGTLRRRASPHLHHIRCKRTSSHGSGGTYRPATGKSVGRDLWSRFRIDWRPALRHPLLQTTGIDSKQRCSTDMHTHVRDNRIHWKLRRRSHYARAPRVSVRSVHAIIDTLFR